ncbi:tripartite tricarboxylate transporter TctB family protein [Roseicitreum antarcticum]|uniref:tripartite tricarboxylate transporter TctB family protein n=1 Tax=Roseicitreum antarcticum TaxID=564137 RepID=UPI0015A4EAFB|nr:tripartite tricarboxylate transporter TctB family protein [Roseicitreum antarcticum]
MSSPDKTEFAGEEEGAGYAAPSVDLIAAILLIALSGWYVWEALGFRAPGGWRTGPGLVPAAAGISLMLMAVGLGFTAIRRWGQAQAPVNPELDEDSISDPFRTGMLIGVIFIYLLAMDAITFGLQGYLGGLYIVIGAFEIATVLCLSVLMKLYWNGPLWIIATVAVLWTAALSLIFRNVFLISLPG